MMDRNLGYEMSCLARTTILDPTRSYCKWLPGEHESAGFLSESRFGSLIQSVPLESIIVERDGINCGYDDSDASGTVILLTLVIIVMVTLPIDVGLKYIFQALAAKLDTEVKLRTQVKRTIMSRGANKADVVNSVSNQSHVHL
jgi:hypothetical protein